MISAFFAVIHSGLLFLAIKQAKARDENLSRSAACPFPLSIP
jgi:hypothetical protein